MWGTNLTTMQDIFDVFEKYVDGKITRLPWCEASVQLETHPLLEKLKKLNRSGILTINSQPRVNGAVSDDPAFGWGGPGGIVYQKVLFFFFCSQKAPLPDDCFLRHTWSFSALPMQSRSSWRPLLNSPPSPSKLLTPRANVSTT